MNKFIAKQCEAANFTVASKEAQRQEIARHVEEFEKRQKAIKAKPGQSGYKAKQHFAIDRSTKH